MPQLERLPLSTGVPCAYRRLADRERLLGEEDRPLRENNARWMMGRGDVGSSSLRFKTSDPSTQIVHLHLQNH